MYLPDWSQLRDREHYVQFYSDDSDLEQCVANYFHAGLDAGDSVIFAGTSAHLRGVERHLAAQGWNLDRLQAQGRYLPFDAAALLRRFMVDGRPSADLFSEVLGDQIMSAQRGRRRVRIYGEMVALLWEVGHRSAAVQLEGLWRELAEILTFSLYCAYPERLFYEAADVSLICRAHTLVLPRLASTGLAPVR